MCARTGRVNPVSLYLQICCLSEPRPDTSNLTIRSPAATRRTRLCVFWINMKVFSKAVGSIRGLGATVRDELPVICRPLKGLKLSSMWMPWWASVEISTIAARLLNANMLISGMLHMRKWMNEYGKKNIDHFKCILASGQITLYHKDKNINSKMKTKCLIWIQEASTKSFFLFVFPDWK